MSINIVRSFFGGLELNKILTHWPYITVYALLYTFYAVYYYTPEIQIKNAMLIGCGVLLSIILLYKLIFSFLRFLTRFEIKTQEQETHPPPTETRPPHISPEVWRYKTLLINSQSDIDSAVNDLIVSGVDSGQILELVDYLHDTNQFGRSPENIADTSIIPFHRTKIQIGNSTFTLPFSLHQLDQISPLTPSLPCILISVILGFSSSYLSMTLITQFTNYEKPFLAILLASSTFSIIQPPPIDPYNTSINDPWNSCARPFIITVICSAWRLILDFLCKDSINWDKCDTNSTILYQIYGITIDWDLILPYIFIALKYGLFLSLAMFIGIYGHPVSSFVAILESLSRYALGQNGIGGLFHMAVQLLRGAASVAAVWGLFQIKDTSNTSDLCSIPSSVSSTLVRCSKFRLTILCCSITVSTLINVFPIMLNRYLLKHWKSTFGFPLLATALSFVVSEVFVVMISSSFDILKWFCFTWLVVFELVFPYLYSAHQYFCFHFLVLPQISFAPVIRYISSLAVSPMFLAVSLQFSDKENPLSSLFLAFVITHAVQKMHSQTHVFALAVFISVMLFQVDFGKNDPAINLILSLVIASKAESALPVIKLVQNNKNYQLIMDELFEFCELPYIHRYLTIKLINNAMIMIDVVLKVPTLFWCLLTGGGLGPAFGCPYFFLPHPIRPNFFFDWPRDLNVYRSAYKESSENKPLERTPTSALTALFEKNINEHPVETPVYMSAVRAVARCIGPIIKSGRLGYVNANNVFLFKSQSNNAAFFLHVISVEPTCFRFQLRGLEYKSQTICHEGEETNLDAIVNDYDFSSTNVHAAFYATSCDYDMRLHSIGLMMYDVSTTRLSQAFIGIEGSDCFKWFIIAFAFEVHKFARSDAPIHSHTQSLALSLNDAAGIGGDRIAYLVDMILPKFQRLPEEVNAFQFIIDSRAYFKHVVDFFVVADQNGARQQEGSIDTPLPFEDSSCGNRMITMFDIFFNMFACVVACVFDQGGHVELKNAAGNFNGGNFAAQGWMRDLIEDLPHDASQFILQFVRVGYIACFLASCGLTELPAVQDESAGGLPSDESLADVLQQLADIDGDSVISPINSQRFASEFIVGEKKLYAIAGEKILLFSLSNTKWSVFQVNQEYVRGMWSAEARDILFYGNEESERISIQENIYFLNNLIIQACDTPIGYPAYCSEIFEAYANPFLKGHLVMQ